MLKCGRCKFKVRGRHDDPAVWGCSHHEALKHGRMWSDGKYGAAASYRNGELCAWGYRDIWAARGAEQLLEMADPTLIGRHKMRRALGDER